MFLLVGFVVLVAIMGLALSRAGRSLRVSKTLLRLDDTTAQLGVRVAILLLVVFVALAGELGLETILGAFLAGALLRLVDPERHMIHERFRIRIEAIGYGFLVPVFFVTSGLQFNAASLFRNPNIWRSCRSSWREFSSPERFLRCCTDRSLLAAALGSRGCSKQRRSPCRWWPRAWVPNSACSTIRRRRRS